MSDHEQQVIAMMKLRGGGFVQALAECMARADSVNFHKLKGLFPDYWRQYEAHLKSFRLSGKKIPA